MGWGGPGYGAAPPRPTGVTLAAIYLIVMGVLLALVGGCTALIGGGVQQLENQQGSGTAFGGSFAIFGLIIIIVSIAGIVAGAGALSRAGWARWLGIIVSVVMVLVFALLAFLFFQADGGTGFAVSEAVIAVLYGLTAFALFAAGSWFAAARS